jgi:hypothetical protein
MVQVLHPREVVGSPTSIAGETGHQPWKTCSLLLIMVSIITAVGLVALTVELLDLRIQLADLSASGRHSQSLGLSPQSQANISGASRTSGTTSAPVSQNLGSEIASCFRTNQGIKSCAGSDPEMAPTPRSIFRPRAIESPATVWGSTLRRIRRWFSPSTVHVPAS